MGQAKPFRDAFNQDQIEMMERAIERAWSVIRPDVHGDEAEARSMLSLCVLNEAQGGEENHVYLVNRAILAFRRRRAAALSQRRRAQGRTGTA
jgi:hypothetical protein